MRLIRNVFRRKLRAFLTISGITIGVFALVVMGGMAEKINLLVEGGSRYYSDKVTVSDAGAGAMGAAPMSIDALQAIEAVDGVAVASATVYLPLDEEAGFSMGMPAAIVGSDMRGAELESFEVSYSAGRELTADDRGMVVVGADLVGKLGAEVGKTLAIRGEPFEVVGIMEKTLTAPDTTVMMSLADAQRLFHRSLPAVVRDQVDATRLATGVTAYVDPGSDPDEVAAAVESEVAGVTAFGPKGFQEQIGQATRIFNAIIFGIALISLLVGGLSVINTMTMSVSERTREIGIRKAIGASHWQIVRQFLAESGFIGLLGGVTGLALGWLFATAANAAGNDAGTALFLVSGRLALGAVLFALGLGVASGLYPSWRAARLNPVAALRYE